MARPCRISNEQILEAARRLFLERGLDVPTAEVARAAGVSEGSVFKRFPTKEALVFAAMGVDREPSWLKHLEPGQGEVRANLLSVVREGIEFFREMLPRMMLLWSRRECSQRLWHATDVHGPRQMLEAVTDYLEQEMQRGRIESRNAEVVARLVLAGTINYALLEAFDVQIRAPIGAEAYSAELIDSLWSGLAPHHGPSPD